ncbi:MAG: universal stress protein [Caldilineaceae bacterium]|nr:universal stress protein [Caldilineaceae bacterium]
MKRKILVPLDGSPFAERVLAFVRHLAPPKTSELLLVHVSQPSSYYAVPVPDMLHTVDITHWQEQAANYLKRIQEEWQAEGYEVTSVLSEGDIASNICDVADAQGADLIAMTTHGRSGIEKWVLGSVADRVVRTASQPVFLVRPQAEQTPSKPIERILVPLDGSRLAEQALPAAVELAQANGSEVWLLQSVEFPEYWGEEYAGMHSLPSMLSTEEQEEEARQYLLQVGKGLSNSKISAQIFVTTGHAASAISDVVADNEIDLIVMSTHGRSGLSRWVFGSVAEKVVRLAECPVLLIRSHQSDLPQQEDQNAATAA